MSRTNESRNSYWSRRGRILGLLALNLLVLIVSLGALEIYLRHHKSYVVEQRETRLRKAGLIESNPELLVQYTPKGRRLIPNAHVLIRHHNLSGRDIKIDINSLGFRDQELPRGKPPDELRVLVLGDSITFGDYLDADEVYVEQAEKVLQAAMPGRKIEVVNGGVGDVGLKEEVDILEERGLSLNPDVVVIAFFLNDSRPPWGFPGELGSSGFLRRHSILAQTVYRKLILTQWIQEQGQSRFEWTFTANNPKWQQSRELFDQIVALAQYDWGAAWKEESWPVIDRQLQRLQALQAQHGFSVAVMVFPVKYQVYADFLEDTPQQRMRHEAEKFGFAYLDLLPILRAKNHPSLFYDHCHLNEPASALIGQALALFLQQELFSHR